MPNKLNQPIPPQAPNMDPNLYGQSFEQYFNPYQDLINQATQPNIAPTAGISQLAAVGGGTPFSPVSNGMAYMQAQNAQMANAGIDSQRLAAQAQIKAREGFDQARRDEVKRKARQAREDKVHQRNRAEMLADKKTASTTDKAGQVTVEQVGSDAFKVVQYDMKGNPLVNKTMTSDEYRRNYSKHPNAPKIRGVTGSVSQMIEETPQELDAMIVNRVSQLAKDYEMDAASAQNMMDQIRSLIYAWNTKGKYSGKPADEAIGEATRLLVRRYQTGSPHKYGPFDIKGNLNQTPVIGAADPRLKKDSSFTADVQRFFGGTPDLVVDTPYNPLVDPKVQKELEQMDLPSAY